IREKSAAFVFVIDVVYLRLEAPPQRYSRSLLMKCANGMIRRPRLSELEVSSVEKTIQNAKRIELWVDHLHLFQTPDMRVRPSDRKRIQLKRDKSEQNRIKTGQKREAEPSRSVLKEPSRLVPKESSRSVLKEPTRSVLEEPYRSVPKEPTRLVPEDPSRSVPKEPTRSVPKEPSRSVLK
nr:hypothetical protein [Tanacetum cinerariifolium]